MTPRYVWSDMRPGVTRQLRVQRWVSRPLTDGRVFVRYCNGQPRGNARLFDVPGVGEVLFLCRGQWDYDRCAIIGTKEDLGSVTVDGGAT